LKSEHSHLIICNFGIGFDFSDAFAIAETHKSQNKKADIHERRAAQHLIISTAVRATRTADYSSPKGHQHINPAEPDFSRSTKTTWKQNRRTHTENRPHHSKIEYHQDDIRQKTEPQRGNNIIQY
jgi:hypothetical protein